MIDRICTIVRMSIRGIAMFFVFATVATFAPPVYAQDAKLGVAQNEAVQDVAADLLKEIYKRAGLTVSIEPYPIVRLADMVQKNEIDGEVSRIGLYFESNPNLIKVEPAYYHLVTAAFAKADKKISVSAPEGLKNHRVGIIRGVYHAAKATEGFPNVVVVDNVTQLFKMLSSDRIDVAVDVSLNGSDVINQLNLKNVQLIGNLAQRELYHVLIPSKKHLAPKISRAIMAMKASGELDSLAKKFEVRRLGAEVSRAAPPQN
jgi:ABC-type amino acid transport substrate-binding protein